MEMYQANLSFYNNFPDIYKIFQKTWKNSAHFRHRKEIYYNDAIQ